MIFYFIDTDLQHCALLPLQHEPDLSILSTPKQPTVLSEKRLQTEYPIVIQNEDKTLSTPPCKSSLEFKMYKNSETNSNHFHLSGQVWIQHILHL